jgi:proline racemase
MMQFNRILDRFSGLEGRVKEHTTVAGLPAIIPTITGRAWVMGEATWQLDPSDPFPKRLLSLKKVK